MPSPAQLAINPLFSPPPQSGSAMSNPHSAHPHGPFNPFSPISVPANGTPGPLIQSPSHQFALHLPRQSVSLSGTPANPNEWDPYSNIYPPSIQQATPPALGGGSGIWTPPFGVRNDSPGFMGMPMHGHSASQFNMGFAMDNPMDPYGIHHGLVGQERFHQQQIRRGSPLAQVRQPPMPMEPEREDTPYPGPTIDAPVPKHRHQISVNLQQEFEDSEGYPLVDSRPHQSDAMIENMHGEGFTTNPVSPAPPAVPFPEQPDMPSVEVDVHLGPELASNPDDDLSDIATERQMNKQGVRKREDKIEHTQTAYEPDQQQQQQFMPQSQYTAVHPHSREQSLSQQQLQHDYDSADPIQNSAISMLMAGDGLGGGGRDHRLDEVLSEDGRTNVSDIVTNPSEPPSPRRTFSSASHGHHLSNTSIVWGSEHTMNAPGSTTSSASKPKLNAKAAEFKFDPSASFSFVPKSKPFSPPAQVAAETPSRGQGSGSAAAAAATGFGGFGSGFNPVGFGLNLASPDAYGSLLETGAAAFSPSAPPFTPSFTDPTPPTAIGSIFGDIVKPPPVKKVIPIVRPPSSHLRSAEGDASAADSDDRREDTASGGRKRAKHSPAPAGDDIEVPALSTLTPPPVQQDGIQAEKEIGDNTSECSDDDEGEELMQTPVSELLGPSFPAFEFPNKLEAKEFANASPMDCGPGHYEPKADVVGRSSPEEESVEGDSPTPQATTPRAEKKTPNLQPEFSIKPTTQEFNFEFPRSTTSPKKAHGVGISESRYAHTPSPPPTHPAPSPPILPDGSTFMPPRAATPYVSDIEPDREVAPMPTDAELDEVIKYMEHADTIFVDCPAEEAAHGDDGDEAEDDGLQAVSADLSAWNAGSHGPIFEEPTDTPHKHQILRSAGPSPSPRRGDPRFIHHRAASFSPDEPDLSVDANGSNHEDVGIAKDADSDWDDMISENGGKLRPQSRLFFDAHVEELVGGLFQRRLEPVLNALAAINDTLCTVSELGSTRSPGDRVMSDADDEEEGMEVIPQKTSKNRKLEKIKAALSEVLIAQQSGAVYPEPNLEDIREAITANNYSRDFADLKSSIVQMIATAARSEDLADVRSALEDISLRISQGTELADLKAAIVLTTEKTAQSQAEALRENAQIQEEVLRRTSRAQVEALRATVKTDDLLGTKETIRSDISILRGAVRDAVDDIVTNVGDRADETKFALKDASALQRSDIAEVKAAIANALTGAARKEDLVPLHNVLAEAFEKTAKTEELSELSRTMIEIMNTTIGIDLKPTHHEVLGLKKENEQFGVMLQEVLRLAQDSAASMDFHQEAQQEAVKEGHAALTSKVGDVYSAVREVTKFIQSHASKTDMRRNLAEKEQKQDFVAIESAISEAHRHLQGGFEELGRTQPTVNDLRSAVESLASTQPKVGDFKSAFEEVVITNVPGLHDIKGVVADELTAAVPRLSDIKGVVSEEIIAAITGLNDIKSVMADEITAAVPGLKDIKSAVAYEISATVPGLSDIKSVVAEAIRADSGVDEFKKVVEEDRERKVEEFRTVIDQVSKAQPTLHDIRTLMEDVISKQQLFVPLNFDNQDESQKLRRKLETAERDLAHIQKRGDEEAQRAKEWQEKTIELETKLRLAEEESHRQREIAEEKDRRLKAVDEKRHQTLTSAQMQSALLKGALSTLQKSNGELSAKNAELEGSVRQAQASEEKYRAWNTQLEGENRDLRKAIEVLKSEMEESIKVRESFRTKFDRVQGDMRRVSMEIAQEQGKWRKTQDEQNARIEVLEAKLAAEFTKNQNLEGEVRRLEGEEKEAIRLRIETDHLSRASGKAEELIAQLRQESMENQSRIAHLAHQAREPATDTASTEVVVARERLEREVEELRDELERVTEQASLEKEAMDRLLEDPKAIALREAEEEHAKALEEAMQSKAIALQEQHEKYERQLEEVQVQSERNYQITTEDAERAQYFLKERLNIAQAESKSLRDHIESLQTQVKTLSENFKVANVAAQAAAQAATTVREMTAPHVSDERALRESVHVLQTQLQEREARIDQLEGQLSGLSVDKNKIKETEGQLNMYRELLDLRIGDLEEIIHTCSLPQLDRGSLRDAATRLKASLDMQLHEKERMMGIAKPDDTLTVVRSAAAKLPGAASDWWQTVRNRGKVSSDAPLKEAPTPSRPSSAASGFLNGIPTPPSTTLSSARKFGVGFGRSGSTTDDPSSTPRASGGSISGRRTNPAGARRPAEPTGASTKALLFRRGDYDADADSSVLSGEFYDEDDAKEVGKDHGEMEPPYGYTRMH